MRNKKEIVFVGSIQLILYILEQLNVPSGLNILIALYAYVFYFSMFLVS